MPPPENQVHAAVDRALDQLIHLDRHLLDADCSERSVTHQLAVHLATEFPDYNVDCEYNRDGFDVKRLQLAERNVRVSDDELDAVTVFPDIVVHTRAANESNLLVIEMKKVASRAELTEYDLLKLRIQDRVRLHSCSTCCSWMYARPNPFAKRGVAVMLSALP